MIWLTGLSGAGKTTNAVALEKAIQRKGYFTKIFDGDVIREGLNKDLGFTDEDRKENIRRIAEVTRIFMDSGLIVICSFISPNREAREMARQIIGEDKFIEVYINCPLDVCEKRDVKGLYKRARNGEIKNFTGISSPYEAPENPDLEIRTDMHDLKETTRQLIKFILPKIRFKKRRFIIV